MRGSCVEKSILPEGVQGSLSDPAATSSVLAVDPFCTNGNHTARPTPAPTPGPSKSYSVMATVIVLCCTVLGLVIFFMVFVAWRSIALANWFEERRMHADPRMKHEQDENPVCAADPPEAVSESQLLMTGPVTGTDPLTNAENVAVAFDSVGYRVGSNGIFGPVTGAVFPGQMVR